MALALGFVVATQAGAQQPRPPARPQAPAPRPAQPARPAAKPRAEQTVPFRAGETLTYDVAWSRYLTAGTATSRVVEKRSSYGSTAWYLVAEGRPIPLIARFYSVFYKMDSLLDSYTALSQRSSLYAEEAGRARTTTTLFNRGTRKAQFEVRTTTVLKDEFTVPHDVQDGLATLYALRSRTLKAGDRFSIPVTDDGALYTASFQVTGPEAVSVPFGEMQAWNIRVTILDALKQPVGENVGAWISTDARRLPLRLEAALPVGTFGLALRSVEQAAPAAK
jgi:hypothetical protein